MSARSVLSTNLRDGTSIDLRPLTPDDKSLLEDGFDRLSERSRRLRFLTSIERLSPSQLAYLTEVDFKDHVAWAAMHDGRGVGVARFVRTEGRRAEVAVAVTDEFQGRGLGSLLVGLLAAAAPSCQVETFEFIVLPENTPMLQIVGRWGGEMQADQGLVHATVATTRIPLDGVDPEAVRLATAAMRNE